MKMVFNHFYILLKLYPDKPWDWRGLSQNSNVTWDIVRVNPDKPWDWQKLSYNRNVTWNIVKENPDKPWNWRELSRNLNVTSKRILTSLGIGGGFLGILI